MKERTAMKNKKRLPRDIVIDSILRDIASYSGKTQSQLVKEAIVSQYIDPYWYPTIKVVYDQDLSIGQFLSLIWMDVDVIGNRDMAGIVKYAAEKTRLCLNCPSQKNVQSEFDYLYGLLESLILYLKADFKVHPTSLLERAIDNLITIINNDRTNTIKIDQTEIYRIIIQNWNCLYDKTKVFNLLRYMAKLQTGWQNLPSDRIELLSLLKRQK